MLDDEEEEEQNLSRISSSRLSWKSTLLLALALALTFAGLGFFGSPTAQSTVAPSRERIRALLEDDQYIRLACHGTSYPEVCVSSLTQDPRSRQGFSSPYPVIQLAIDIAMQSSLQSLNLSKSILDRAGSNRNLTAATRDCVQVLGFATTRYRQCQASFSSGLAVKDVEAWLSGILAYQYDCFSALGYVNSSREVQSTMSQVGSGMLLISNALSMTDALDLYGVDVSKWKPPPSKRQNLAAKSASKHRHWIQPEQTSLKGVKFSAVVDKHGSSGFRSVQNAIDSAPDNSGERFVIHIKQGVYEERVYVPESKKMIVLVGDGVDETIITGSDYVRDGVTTMETSTMLIAGDGFVARNLTIRNTAGPDSHQAVAIRINADKVVFQSCSLLGFQDTLYSHTLRHYFEDCTIAGTVDFIFGNSAAVFKNCNLLVRPGRTGVYTSMVTAHGRIDPAQTTGFAFHNCRVDAAPDFHPNSTKFKTYLGRPWKMFSRSVFIDCYLGSIVAPEGWLAWKGDFALETLLFGEYDSQGPGASDLSKRVNWSTQLKASQADAYSVSNFIQGSQWIH